jgi:hypothetical protein
MSGKGSAKREEGRRARGQEKLKENCAGVS